MNEVADFTVFSLFDYLDVNRDGRLTELEIQDFGRVSGISLTLNDCQRVINEYDNDNKGYITIKEFENFVLSAERESLKQNALGWLSGRASVFVLDAFVDLLLAEVDFN